MRMILTRKAFSEAAASGTVLLMLQACGGGGDDGKNAAAGTGTTGTGGNPAPAALSCGANGAAIVGNHGDSLTIPVADLVSGVEKTYSIQGTASHDHQIMLTAAQLRDLKSHKEVIVISTTTLSHEHGVTSSGV